jgi:transcription elongation factor/antiterminator RfaH
MEYWYTLYTKPNAEYGVAAILRRRGIHTFLPEIASPNPRQKHRKRPFFPCYLFAEVDFEQVGPSSVQWTPGLRRVVAFGGRPVPVPDEVINLIRRKLEALNAAGGWPVGTFQPGETVRITDGPLEGMLAIFDGPSTPSERVWVLLDFLGHASRARICLTDLEKVPRKSQAPTSGRPRRTRGRGRRINYRPG